MNNSIQDINPTQQYAIAHNTHYKMKDVHEAIVLYRDLIANHPGSKEAEYSRSQVQNIVHSVVPEQIFIDALGALALTHIEKKLNLV